MGSVDASVYAEVAPEFEALSGALFEISAGCPAVLVDRARVCALRGAEVNTRAVGARGERLLAEMPGLQLLHEVISTEPPPPDEIRFGDQDPPVVTGAATRAAGETVEFVAHERGGTRVASASVVL